MEQQIEKYIKKRLSKHACYILITCETPSCHGEMNVEMFYGGDPVLASLLLEGASDVLESEVENGDQESSALHEVS